MQGFDIKKFETEFTNLLHKQLPIILANYTANFFKENFRRQGWAGKSFKAWKNTKSKSQKFGHSSGILIGTGNLKKSIRTNSVSSNGFRIIAGNQNVPYASVHNDGGTVNPKVTEQSRKFFWYMFKKTGDIMWKKMALTKKSKFTVRIPQRQFIGESEVLNKELQKLISKKINQLIHS